MFDAVFLYSHQGLYLRLRHAYAPVRETSGALLARSGGPDPDSGWCSGVSLSELKLIKESVTRSMLIVYLFSLLQKESDDMAKKKKRDMEIMHGVNRSMLLEEYVAKVRIDLHSQRAREKRERISAMMQMYSC